jgi:phospholipid/cholesterol/gamma-HCH transport system substrate-binding protein
MEYRSSEVKAGFFIFVSIVTLIGMIFMLGNLQERFRDKQILRIVFNFTGGLEEGAPVRYAGLDVGRVSHIELLDSVADKDMDQVTVVTEIDPSITIKKNSTAMIKTSGLMGGLYIDIRPGTRSAQPLEEGQALMGQDSFEFAQIGDMVEEVVVQVRRFIDLADGLVIDSQATLRTFQGSLENVNGLIDESRGDLRENLKNITRVTTDLAEVLEENRDSIRETIQSVHSVASKADHLLEEKGTQLEEIIDQTHRLTREMEILMADTRPGVTSLVRTMEADTEKISQNIDTVASSFEETLNQGNAILVENRRTLLEALKNLNDTSRNLKVLSEDIKLNPWKLVRKSDEKEPEEDMPHIPQSIRMKRLDKVSGK